jgi:hypothetical protein
MSRAFAAALVMAGAASLAATSAPGAAAATAAPPPKVSIDIDRSTVSTTIGGRFSFASTVRNNSGDSMTGVIVHLNVLSVDPAVYVDPEDWSVQRTQYIDVLPAGSARRVTWEAQAVNVGRFVAYLGVTTREGTDTVTASSALRVSVAEQRTLNPSGIVPLAAGMPMVVLVLLVLAVRRRRRLR